MQTNDELGAAGEQVVADYLLARGYRVLDRNWRCPHGELDLVVTNGHVIVAVEVKTRTNRKYGHPPEAITVSKQRRLRLLLSEWARQHEARGRLRIDGVSVDWPAGSEPVVEHRRGIA